MIKNTRLLMAVLISALLLHSASCQAALGSYTTINVRSLATDPNVCRIMLDSDVDYISNATRAYTNISQSYAPPSPMTSMPASCKFQNLTFVSFFKDDPATYNVPYTQPVRSNYDANGNLVSSFVNNTVHGADLAAMNGTQCFYVKESQSGYDQYICKINYGGTPLYWVAYGTGSGNTFQFGPFAGARSKWVVVENHLVIPESYWAKVDVRASTPNITGEIFSSCGSNNRNFYSLQVPITVTAPIDLAAFFPDNFGYNIANAYILVKKNGATTSHIVKQTALSAIRGGEKCWTLGVTWDKVLPDMNYCAGGCQVTFIFAGNASKIYVLETTGIKTVSNLRG